MNGRFRLAMIGGALAALAAAPATANAKVESLTADAARAKVVLHEDPLEHDVVLSTEKVMRSTRGVLRTPFNDNHLRASINLETGKTRFEVRQTLQYLGNYRDFSRVHFETSAAPVAMNLRKLNENQAHCDAIDPQSACYEEVSFVVEEAELRRMAAGAATGETWSFKFKPQMGQEHRSSLPKVEIAGLLQAVDDYRARTGSGLAPAFPAQGAP